MPSGKESEITKASRRIVILILIATVLIFGIPLYRETTSIYRAELPGDEIQELSNTLKERVHFNTKVYLDLDDSFSYMIPQAESLIKKKLNALNEQLLNVRSIELLRKTEPIDYYSDYILTIKHVKDDQKKTEQFDITPLAKAITIYFTDENLNKIDEMIANVLVDHIFKEEVQEFNNLMKGMSKPVEKDLVIPYSPKYNVVFSLVIENGRSVAWEIDEALLLFTPLFDRLKHFTNFTVSTQIQRYCFLTSEPKEDASGNFLIDEPSLSTFVNYGDWNLVNYDINPTINFIVYFPKVNFDGKQLKIENSKSNSFLIPQWGGVYIFNKDMPILSSSEVLIPDTELSPIMEVFASQLVRLLGMPSCPKSLLTRIDILSRLTIYNNLKGSLDNLVSLIKLTDSLSEISIPSSTRTHVLEALDCIRTSIALVNKSKFSAAMEYSSKALLSSNRAFFEKEMVQQTYFPSEHKLAVFLPLLGPMCSILVLGLIKLVKEFKKERKLKKE
ncbi:uncharacterized protein PRCAT00002424001 [Priceomyces carsonii]|uniref:uncharacterized protein n=1 Tax=Priceomyces carsonii TaxID=28549 RepID=UPI002ED97FAE|nr:unnamed protein product [Priceomyces carsonii]